MSFKYIPMIKYVHVILFLHCLLCILASCYSHNLEPIEKNVNWVNVYHQNRPVIKFNEFFNTNDLRNFPNNSPGSRPMHHDLNFEKKFISNNNKFSSYWISDNNSENDQDSENILDCIDYPVNETFSKIIDIQANSSVKILITAIDRKDADFLVVQAHSQVHQIILSYDKVPKETNSVNDTNAGLVVFLPENCNTTFSPVVYAHNLYLHKLSILFLVRNYTNREPIPGGLYIYNSTVRLPHPYLFLDQNLLTTWISFPLVALYNITQDQHHSSSSPPTPAISSEINPAPLFPSKSVTYDVYITYMYEGDLFEQHYWDIVVKTSTVEKLKKNANKVLEISPEGILWYHTLFVSYSGVGTVVNVVASFNDSDGVLYSSTVFYGCDFINTEKYDCTKLVSTLAKLFCASLPFVGFILLFLGHRWLNVTMSVAGFLATWFILFVIFAQVPNADNYEVVGMWTLFGALSGGIGWLVVWHRFRRPFYSALLIILLSSLFIAMISTHFLKYALVPSPSNLAAFVVFPIAFSVTIIAYSVFDIKKVHIFACSLLGSYGLVVPFAFYLGSTLTYIVINVVSVMTISQFSEAVGYPPFQDCDIALLCVWIVLFVMGIAYQGYRERAGPPFHPPNTTSLSSLLNGIQFLKEKTWTVVCGGSSSSDDDSLFEDRPSLVSRFAYLCSSRRESREHLSAYESFPRIGSDDEGSLKEAIIEPFRKVTNSLRQALTQLRQKIRGSEALQEEEEHADGGETTEPLEEEGGGGGRGVHRETDLEDDSSEAHLRRE